jgi:thioredoxin-like negative regulator of GroEL
LAPVLEELAGEYTGRVKFVILNLDENKVVAAHERINGTPTLFFYNRGQLTDRVEGAVPRREITRRLDAIAVQA